MDKNTRAIIKFVRNMQGTGRYKRQTLIKTEQVNRKREKCKK